MEQKCPKCHVVVRPTDYFCYNCGNNLKPPPPPVDLVALLALFAKSILLPPFGILWAYKYIKFNDSKTRMIGIAAFVATIISFIISMVLFKNFMDNVNKQVNQQLNSMTY